MVMQQQTKSENADRLKKSTQRVTLKIPAMLTYVVLTATYRSVFDLHSMDIDH